MPVNPKTSSRAWTKHAPSAASLCVRVPSISNITSFTAKHLARVDCHHAIGDGHVGTDSYPSQFSFRKRLMRSQLRTRPFQPLDKCRLGMLICNRSPASKPADGYCG